MTEEPRKPYRRLRRDKPKPSLPWKGLLTVGALALLVAGAAKWWETSHGGLSAELTQHHKDGRAYGVSRDHRDCLQDVLSTVGGCEDEACADANFYFLKGCMATAEIAPYCDVAPRFPSSQRDWAEEKCLDEGLSLDWCPAALVAAPRACDESRKKISEELDL